MFGVTLLSKDLPISMLMMELISVPAKEVISRVPEHTNTHRAVDGALQGISAPVAPHLPCGSFLEGRKKPPKPHLLLTAGAHQEHRTICLLFNWSVCRLIQRKGIIYQTERLTGTDPAPVLKEVPLGETPPSHHTCYPWLNKTIKLWTL